MQKSGFRPRKKNNAYVNERAKNPEGYEIRIFAIKIAENRHGPEVIIFWPLLWKEPRKTKELERGTVMTFK